MTANIVVDAKTSFVDAIYSYRVPADLEEKIRVGQRAEVPFGSGNKRRIGYVVSLSDDTDDSFKEIISLVDGEPLLSRQDMVEAYWIRNRYFCTFAAALKLFLPCGAATEVRERIEYCAESEDIPLTKTQTAILGFLREKGFATYDSVKKYIGKSVRPDINLS